MSPSRSKSAATAAREAMPFGRPAASVTSVNVPSRLLRRRWSPAGPATYRSRSPSASTSNGMIRSPAAIEVLRKPEASRIHRRSGRRDVERARVQHVGDGRVGRRRARDRLPEAIRRPRCRRDAQARSAREEQVAARGPRDSDDRGRFDALEPPSGDRRELHRDRPSRAPAHGGRELRGPLFERQPDELRLGVPTRLLVARRRPEDVLDDAVLQVRGLRVAREIGRGRLGERPLEPGVSDREARQAVPCRGRRRGVVKLPGELGAANQKKEIVGRLREGRVEFGRGDPLALRSAAARQPGLRPARGQVSGGRRDGPAVGVLGAAPIARELAPHPVQGGEPRVRRRKLQRLREKLFRRGQVFRPHGGDCSVRPAERVRRRGLAHPLEAAGRLREVALFEGGETHVAIGLQRLELSGRERRGPRSEKEQREEHANPGRRTRRRAPSGTPRTRRRRRGRTRSAGRTRPSERTSARRRR